jgi:hypothetical protein
MCVPHATISKDVECYLFRDVAFPRGSTHVTHQVLVIIVNGGTFVTSPCVLSMQGVRNLSNCDHLSVRHATHG